VVVFSVMCVFLSVCLLARLQENSHSYHYKTCTLDLEWLMDHTYRFRFELVQNPRPGARLAVTGTTVVSFCLFVHIHCVQKKHPILFSCITLTISTDLSENFRQYNWWNDASTSLKILCLLNILASSNQDSSKTTITAMWFTIENHYLIKCSSINKKYEANHFLMM